ncbi:hypothetical protein CYMTET_54999 [Cymbomonas tetramitiformis]|uniref:Uncharacterized protein n=1 Tax=Cymbomonas tetramitiformis TaxID=36881 RepID=A0AAE0ENE7_9CHLO|nr:hypothetical protein CYMTET_54999 [Cymbomonas tetramitiformis]
MNKMADGVLYEKLSTFKGTEPGGAANRPPGFGTNEDVVHEGAALAVGGMEAHYDGGIVGSARVPLSAAGPSVPPFGRTFMNMMTVSTSSPVITCAMGLSGLGVSDAPLVERTVPTR